MKRLLSPRILLPTLVILLVMILAAIYLPVPLPTISLPAEAIPGWNILGFPITNTLLATLLADITVILFCLAGARRLELVPGRLQNLLESIVELFLNFAQDLMGPQARRFVPLALTVFMLILAANWWGRVPGFEAVGVIEKPHIAGTQMWSVRPVGGNIYTVSHPATSIYKGDHGGDQKAEGAATQAAKEESHAVPTEGVLLPFLRGATTDLNFPLSLALIAFFYIQYQGFRALGAGYLRKFFNFSSGITIFVGLLELISEFAKIISFSFRLFGNIFAGTVLVFVMSFLIPLFIPMPFALLEVLIGLIQAAVFAILILVFTAGAIESHEDHETHVADTQQAMEGAEQVAHAH